MIIYIKNKPFFDIYNGSKKIEGRLYTSIFKNIKINDTITLTTFIHKKRYSIHRTIKYIKKYNNFKTLLINEGLHNTTPHLKTIDDAVKLYHSIYPVHKINKYGVMLC
jgi:ASC-1-like (ASCH) protein